MKEIASELIQRSWPKPFRPLKPTDANSLLGIDCPDSLPIDALSEKLADELRSEIIDGHPLYGATVCAIASNIENHNEVVFLTDIPAYHIAWVHLTYQKEKSPDFPYTAGYPSFESFVKAIELNGLTRR